MATGRRSPALDRVDMAPSGPHRRRPRWHYLLLVLVLLAGLVAAGLVLLQRPAIGTSFANAVFARFHPVPRATVGVAEVRGDWLTHLELRGVRITRGDTLLGSIDTLRARYGLGSLLTGKLHVRDLHLSGVFVTADIVDTTTSAKRGPPLTLADLLRGRFYSGPPIRVDRLAIQDATYSDRGGSRDSLVILDHIGLLARRVRLGGDFSFELDSLGLGRAPRSTGSRIDFGIAARLDRGRFEAHSLRFRSGSSTADGSIVLGLDDKDAITEARLTLKTLPLALRDLDMLTPGLDLDGAVVADIDVSGLHAREMSGRISATCDHGRWGPLSLQGVRLDATFTDGGAETKLSGLCGQARLEVTGSSRPFDRVPTYDLVARTDRLPDRIPGPAWWTDLARRVPAAVTMRLRGSGYAKPILDLVGRATGSAGDIDVDAHLDMTRDFAWSVRRLRFDRVDIARWMGDTTASTLSGSLTASGKSAFARSRTVEAELELAPSRYGEWRADRGRVHLRLSGADFAARVGIDSEFDVVGARGQTTSEFQGRIAGTAQGLGFLMGSSRASALRDGRVAAKLRLDLEPSRVAQYEILGTSLGLTLARGRVNVDGVLASQAGRADLSAHGRPFDSAPSYVLERARFNDVDLSAWTGNRALSSRISGNLTGQGGFGAGSSTGGTWEGTLQLDPSRLGRLDVTNGHARASWTNGNGSLLAVLLAAGDTLSARGRMTTRDGTPRGRADLTVPLGLLAALAGRDSLKTSGSLTAEASFVGTKPATADLDGTLRSHGSVGDLRIDSLLAGLRLRQGTLFLDTLVARSNVGTASGAGQLALFDTTGASDIRVALRVRDAKPLRTLLDADTLAVDSARVDLHVRGSEGRRHLDARAAIRALAWNDTRIRWTEGNVQADLDSQWRPVRAHAEGSVQRVRGVALPWHSATALLDLEDGETRIDLHATRDERHDLRLVARARSDSTGGHLALETIGVRADSATWALTHPARIDYGQGRLAIDDFDLRSGGGRIHARGVIDRRGDQSFRLEMNGVGLDVLTTALGRPDVAGTLGGTLELEGPAAAPRGSGGLDLDLVAAGHAAGNVRSRLSWNGRRLDFGGHFATPKMDSLTWTGSLPLQLSLASGDSGAPARVRVMEGDVDVRLLARQFPLEALGPLLDPKAVGPLQGTLDLDARLKGNSHSIAGDGRVEVKHGVLPLPGLGVVYRDIDALATLRGDRVAVDHARVTSDKGRIDATGEFRLVSLTRVEPRMHVESRKFVVADAPDLRAILSGSVDVTGTLTSPVVKGKATIENSSFTMGPVASAESGPAIQLTEADVRMLEETFGDVSAAPRNAGLLLYDASDLDLNIKLEGNNWIRQNARPKLSVALTGDVHLKKAPHREPELFGRIAPIPNRGYVEQFARSFDIVGGEVLLNGPMTAHRVDIQAQYKPSSDTELGGDDTVIKLDVQGSINKLSLVLSSEPAMSEAEIVSYIATGHSPTVDRMGTGSSSNDKSSLATDIGLSQIAGFAEEPAREAVGLDVLQVRFDALKGATLVAGRYLDPQLYVGFRQPLQYKETSSPSAGETNRTSVEVEYAVHQWLVLNLQGETSKLRSFIRARHAY